MRRGLKPYSGGAASLFHEPGSAGQWQRFHPEPGQHAPSHNTLAFPRREIEETFFIHINLSLIPKELVCLPRCLRSIL